MKEDFESAREEIEDLKQRIAYLQHELSTSKQEFAANAVSVFFQNRYYSQYIKYEYSHRWWMDVTILIVKKVVTGSIS